MQEWRAVVEEAEHFLQADVLLQLAESAPRLAGTPGCLSGWVPRLAWGFLPCAAVNCHRANSS